MGAIPTRHSFECKSALHRSDMSRIKIIPEAKKPSVPRSQALIHEVDRVKNTGKPPLPIDKSFNKQGMKG